MTHPPTVDSALEAIERWEPQVQALVDWKGRHLDENSPTATDGPLAGWPVAVKDIIDVEGVLTRCNADFVPAEPAARDAAVVAQLRTQGACIIAKSVTTTFAYYDPGPTRNPWSLAHPIGHTPGGSSSGSAAAVACGMARLALGSQTVGSVNRPASFCGVVGFKPTYDRLSVEGVFPFAPTVDTLGIFTRDAADVRTAFSALVGEAKAPPPPTARLRFGLVEDMLCEAADPPMRAALHAAADQLRNEGHRVVPLSIDPMVRLSHEHHQVLIASEAAASHKQLFARHRNAYTPKLKALVERGRSVTPQALAEAHAHRMIAQQTLSEQLSKCDAVISPSAPGEATPGLQATGDPRMNLLWTYVGFPTLTLPAALGPNGLPLGIQLTSDAGTDHTLLALGSTVERAIDFRHTLEQS